MNNKKRILIFLACGLLVALCGYSYYWLDKYNQYDKAFTPLADAAVPKLGELNKEVLSELPSPDGVEFVSQSNIEPWSPIGTRMYYVYLYADYKITNTNPQEIFSYYRNLLKEKGWQQTTPNDHVFYHGSTSLELSIYSQDTKEYTLYIYHDFWSQDFSPPRPSNDIAFIWCNLHPGICTPPTTPVKH